MWRYPGNAVVPTGLTVRSFDESGGGHVRYAVDTPAEDAAAWADVRSGRATIPSTA